MLSRFQIWWEALRPIHWVKSGFCLAALVFSGQGFSPSSWVLVVPLLVAMSLLSSAGYLWNDFVNQEEDRHHPRKRRRPLASGRMHSAEALALGGAAAAAGLLVLFFGYGIGMVFWLGVGYLGLTGVYSLWLRNVPVLDVLALSLGFVIRVAVGAFAIQVVPTWWLMACTYALGTFLGFAKRRGELLELEIKGEEVGSTRRVLEVYNLVLLDTALALSAALCGATYLVYAVRMGSVALMVSVLPVIFGIGYYLHLARRSEEVERPEHLLIRSPVLQSVVAVWLVLVVVSRIP